jgi:hypothetical protein
MVKRKDRQTIPLSKKKRKDKKTKYTYNYIENYRFGNINYNTVKQELLIPEMKLSFPGS